VPSLGRWKLLRGLAQQGRSPCSDSEKRAEQNNGIDAFAALDRPIGRRIEIEPEGEFIEGESSACAIGDGEQPAEEDRAGSISGSYFSKRGVAAEQKQKDSPDEMVDVPAADDHVAEWSDVMLDGEDEQSGREKGNEE